MGKEKDRKRNIGKQKNRIILKKGASVPEGYEKLSDIYKTLRAKVDGEYYEYAPQVLIDAVNQAIQSLYFPFKTYQKKFQGAIYARRSDVVYYLQEIYVPNYNLQGQMSDIAKLYSKSKEKKEGLGSCPKGLRLGVDFNTEPKCAVNRCLNHRRCESFYNELKKMDDNPMTMLKSDQLYPKTDKKRKSNPMRKNRSVEATREKKKSQGKLPLKPLKSESDISETRLYDLIDHLYEMRENDVIREEITNAVVYLSEALKHSRIISADETKKVQHGS